MRQGGKEVTRGAATRAPEAWLPRRPGRRGRLASVFILPPSRGSSLQQDHLPWQSGLTHSGGLWAPAARENLQAVTSPGPWER